MGVTLDLFDSKRIYRGTVVQGLSELIHDERRWTVTAEIPACRKPRNGEYIGFWCVDGRYRLFEIEDVEQNEETNTATISGVDAAINDLAGAIVGSVHLESAGISQAVSSVMNGLGWRVNVTSETDDTEDVAVYYKPAWDALSAIADDYNVRITPHYTIEGGTITGKILDVTDKTSTYRGRLVEQGHDAGSVVVRYIGSPRPMVYGLGAAIGTGDPPERITFADVEWSKANGDPADKPKGQTWIADPQALARLPEGEKRGQTVEYAGITDKQKLLRRTWEAAQKKAKPEMSASALISDMEMIAGQTWKAVRMWDRVCVKPKNGDATELQIISIQRNYVRPRLTKMAMGTDEETGMDDLVRQISQLTRSAIRTSATLGSHGAGISQNVTHLEDLDIQVDENRTQIGHVVIDLDAANARIDLMATREELTEVDRTLTSVSIALDAVEGEVLLKASQEYVNEVEDRVTKAEAELVVAYDEISTKVSKDGVISSINQTAESIKIQASRINLSGYVTASEFSSLKSEIGNLTSGTVQASMLYTQNLTATGVVRLAGHTCEWLELKALTDVSLNVTKAQVTINGIIYNFVTAVTINEDSETIDYLGT